MGESLAIEAFYLKIDWFLYYNGLFVHIAVIPCLIPGLINAA